MLAHQHTRRRAESDRLPAAPPKSLTPLIHAASLSGGQALDPATQRTMAARFGHDFSSVRIHTDARARESAEAMGANAYAHGSYIVFGGGRYTPGSPDTERLLAHELTHVVQQARFGPGDPGRRSRGGDASEREAERAASDVTAGRPVRVSAAPQAAIARSTADPWDGAPDPVAKSRYLPGLDPTGAQPYLPGLAPTALEPYLPGLGAPPLHAPSTPDVSFDMGPRNNSPAPGTVGTVTRHSEQVSPRPGMESEHIVPGKQWQDISTPPGGKPIYTSQTSPEYQNDTTVLVEKNVAKYKTHTGPLRDNHIPGRSSAIEARIANGESINVIDDMVLPSIKQTFRALDAVPGSQVMRSQVVRAAFGQLGHQFDMGAGGVDYGSPAVRDRYAEQQAVRAKVAQTEPAGAAGYEDYDWDATFGQTPRGGPGGVPAEQPYLPGLSPTESPYLPGLDPTGAQPYLPGLDPAAPVTLPFSEPPAGAADPGVATPSAEPPAGAASDGAGAGGVVEEGLEEASRWSRFSPWLRGAGHMLAPVGAVASAFSLSSDIREGHFGDATVDALAFGSAGVGTVSAAGAGLTALGATSMGGALTAGAAPLGPAAAVAGSFAAGYGANSWALGKANNYAKNHEIFGVGDDGEARDSTSAAGDAGEWVDEKVHSVTDRIPYVGHGLGSFVGGPLGAVTAMVGGVGTELYSGGHAAVSGISHGAGWLKDKIFGEDVDVDTEDMNKAQETLNQTMDARDMEEQRAELYGN